MKVKESERLALFDTGRGIHPSLGDMFQNEYDLTHEDVKMELGHIETQIRNLHRYKLDILAIEGLVQREERANGKSKT